MPTVRMNEARTYTAAGVVLVPGDNPVTDEQLAAMDVAESGFRYRKNLGVLTVIGAKATEEPTEKPLTKAERKALEKAESTIDAQADELAKLREELAAQQERAAKAEDALAATKTAPAAPSDKPAES